jgi:hypothetical protein
LALAPDLTGSDPFGVGLQLHVQFGNPLLLLAPMPADATGAGKSTLQIPGSPSLVGTQVHTQALWPWNPPSCQPSTIGWSSSSGLTFTIQP